MAQGWLVTSLVQSSKLPSALILCSTLSRSVARSLLTIRLLTRLSSLPSAYLLAPTLPPKGEPVARSQVLGRKHHAAGGQGMCSSHGAVTSAPAPNAPRAYSSAFERRRPPGGLPPPAPPPRSPLSVGGCTRTLPRQRGRRRLWRGAHATRQRRRFPRGRPGAW